MTKSTTGIKYLCVNNSCKKIRYHVKVIILGKNYVVWTGYDFETGKKIATKVQELMAISNSAFQKWFLYEKEGWLIENGYKNANNKKSGY